MFPDTPNIPVGAWVKVYLLTPVINENENKIGLIHGQFLDANEKAVTLGMDMLHPEFVIPMANVAYLKVVGK